MPTDRSRSRPDLSPPAAAHRSPPGPMVVPLLAFALGAALATIAVLGWTSPSLASPWKQCNGPEPPVVTGIARGSGVAMLGTAEADAGEVFRSTDDGASWQNAGFPNGGVTFLEHHEGIFYVGTDLFGSARSTDGGETWLALAGVPDGSTVHAMASWGATVYQGIEFLGSPQLYRSTDGGASFLELSNAPELIALALGTNGSLVLLGTAGAGLRRSTDGGVSWGVAASGIPATARVTSLAPQDTDWWASVVVPMTPSQSGVYRSTDAGASWSKTSVDLVVGPIDDLRRLTAASSGLLLSVVGGELNEGIFRSTDGGIHWARISQALPVDDEDLSILYEDATLWAGTPHGLFRTTDMGESWAPRHHGTGAIREVPEMVSLESGLCVALGQAGGMGRGLWLSGTEGETWTQVAGGMPPNAAVRAFLSQPDALYAALYHPIRGVLRSTDGGVTWLSVSTGISSGSVLNDLLASGGVLFAGAFEALYRSTNSGASWVNTFGPTDVNCLVEFEGQVFAGTNGEGVHRSTDLGTQWIPASAGLTTFFERIGNDFAVVNGQLLLATQGAGIHRWDGASWTQIGLAGQFVNALLVHESTLLAATGLDGLFVSTDGGGTWSDFDEGYPELETYSLGLHDGWLYAGSRALGLWRRPLADLPGAASDVGDATTETRLGAVSIEPQPAVERARLRFSLAHPDRVRIELFDLSGRSLQARTESFSAGMHSVELALGSFARGGLLYRVDAGAETRTGKILLVR